jgi:hypothetical protein
LVTEVCDHKKNMNNETKIKMSEGFLPRKAEKENKAKIFLVNKVFKGGLYKSL